MNKIQVPKESNLVSIESISNNITKGSTPTTYGYEFQSTGIPFLRAENIFLNLLKLNYTKFISKETHEFLKRSKINSGDVLITIAGTIGRATYVPENTPEMNSNQAVAIIKLKDLCIPKYLSYFLNSNLAKRQISDSKVTATISNLSLEMIKRIKIPLFSIPIQKKIVAKLDQTLAELEEKKKEILSLIEQNKKRIDFFEKKWLNFIIDKEIEKHPKRKEWIETTLLELAQKGSDKFADGPFGSNLQVKDYTDSGIPIIRLQNIGESKFFDKNWKFTSQEKYEELVRHSTIPGDVIIAKMAEPVARSTMVPSLFETYMMAADCVKVRINEEKAIPEFVSYAINSSFVRMQAIKFAQGMTRLRINLREIKKLKIPLPSLTTQKQIVKNIKNAEAKFKEQKFQFENIKENYESRINYINHIQSSILDSAFSGKLVN